MLTASEAKTNPPSGSSSEIRGGSSVSCDDASSAGGSAAPASPRSARPASTPALKTSEALKTSLPGDKIAFPAPAPKTEAAATPLGAPIPAPRANSVPQSTARPPATESLESLALKSLTSKRIIVPAAATSASPTAKPIQGRPIPRRPAMSLETLLGEKQAVLARFEAKFNQKILSRHKDLMEEQRRALKTSDEENRYLAEEVQRLKDELEQQKFSHEVELSTQGKKVERLEAELRLRRARGGPSPSVPARQQPSFQAGRRVLKLEKELRLEKGLRIAQLQSLEQLHFAEFREMEKKHATFVTQLASSYQKEIEFLKESLEARDDAAKSIDPDRKAAPDGCESSEHAEAAAALSSLAAPRAATEDHGGSAVTVNIRVSPASDIMDGDTIPPPRACSVASEGRDETGAGDKKRNVPSTAAEGIAFPNPIAPKVSDGEEPEPPQKKKPRVQTEDKTPRRGQEAEDVYRKESDDNVPPPHCPGKDDPPSEHVPIKKAPAKGENKSRMLSESTKEYLKAWMMSPEHCDNPYPTLEEKVLIMRDTGIGFAELNTWFVNNRKRFWLNVVKPRIPEIKRLVTHKTAGSLKL